MELKHTFRNKQSREKVLTEYQDHKITFLIAYVLNILKVLTVSMSHVHRLLCMQVCKIQVRLPSSIVGKNYSRGHRSRETWQNIKNLTQPQGDCQRYQFQVYNTSVGRTGYLKDYVWAEESLSLYGQDRMAISTAALARLHTHMNDYARAYGYCLQYLVYITLGNAWEDLDDLLVTPI